MTTGNNASRAAELIQQGIRQFREGNAPGAYGTFRDVVNYDPNNEFGWIWLSVTSQDYGEKRAALERALQINPNSAHAREALRALNLEAPSPAAAPPPPTQDSPTDRLRPVAPVANGVRRGLRDRIGDRATAPADDNLAQNLRQAPPPKKAGRAAPPPGQLVSTTTAGQSFARAVRVGALILLAIIVIGLVVYFLINRFSNNSVTVPIVANNTTVAATTTIATTPTIAPTSAPATASVATPTAPVALILSPTPAAATTTSATTTAATTIVTTTANASGQIDTLLSNAQASITANDYKTALQTYKQALQLDPSNVQANLRLGLLYMSAPASQLNTTDPYTSAISAFKVVTDQDPTWAGGFAQLGAAYDAKGDLQDAIKAYRTSLDLDPNGSERWLALASLYDRTNQSAEANYARSRAQNLAQNQAAPAISPAATTLAATATPVPPTATPTPKPKATPTHAPAVPAATFTPVVAAPHK